MARMKKVQPDLNSTFFSTPSQKVLRLLLAEPSTTFTPRVICSRLKGVRGLGGVEGLAAILDELSVLGLISFVNNQRAVRIHDESTAVQILSSFLAICDLESLKNILVPISARGVLYGNRVLGKAPSDGEYDLFVVSESPEEVKKAAGRHPMWRDVDLTVWTPDMYSEIKNKDPALNQKLSNGLLLWGSVW